jgi:hypothetical protein
MCMKGFLLSAPPVAIGLVQLCSRFYLPAGIATCDVAAVGQAREQAAMPK